MSKEKLKRHFPHAQCERRRQEPGQQISPHLKRVIKLLHLFAGIRSATICRDSENAFLSASERGYIEDKIPLLLLLCKGPPVAHKQCNAFSSFVPTLVGLDHMHENPTLLNHNRMSRWRRASRGTFRRTELQAFCSNTER